MAGDAYRFHGQSGGCQCGAVRFRVSEFRDDPHICHCRMCQKAVGNLFAALIGVRHEHFAWTRGQATVFASSDQVERGFCAACGTPLFYRSVGGGHVSLCIGALDAPRLIPIAMQSGMEGRHPSLRHLDQIPDAGTTEGEQPERAAAIAAANHQHPDHDTAVWPAAEQTR